MTELMNKKPQISNYSSSLLKSSSESKKNRQLLKVGDQIFYLARETLNDLLWCSLENQLVILWFE